MSRGNVLAWSRLLNHNQKIVNGKQIVNYCKNQLTKGAALKVEYCTNMSMFYLDQRHWIHLRRRLKLKLKRNAVKNIKLHDKVL